MTETTGLSFSDSILIDASPEAVYELVSDVTRTGEWSPKCKAAWWDEGAGPRVGDWFNGRNEANGNTWETRSLVVAAEPGREFTWQVGGELVRWGYTLAPEGEGTRLTESWELLPGGKDFFLNQFGEETGQALIDERQGWAQTGIPETLAAIKAIAERDLVGA
ncbi:SRPBCC family protein [Nakamurella leprariae]|uniref:SRPBCC family protein n=1 Tax=Nakamurella leprariae TaxID=2803911 RepID=A0A939C097_9ACTN|nr:SRPBCC family protein [Nakamurella leprariae]MBM9469000.1 SRPBCC family protein [Nakamurella leprariae]